METIYISLVRSHLEYRKKASCPVLRKDREMLENTQRQVTTLSPASKDSPVSYDNILIGLELPNFY